MKQKIENRKADLKEQKERLDKLVATWNLYENGGTIYYNLPHMNELERYYNKLSRYDWAEEQDYENDYNTFKDYLKYFKNIIKFYPKVDFIHTFDFMNPLMPESIYNIQVTDELIQLIEKICQKLELNIGELESELQELENASKAEKMKNE
ncbi:hypothetical protein [Methanobrevibacter sp.]|uniref:hypothetical protein n=1 Tax=Methanobrevibacter sp. TaxID=66852 RepID=UPI002E77FFC7|nr:hypothetical protein [Methanobrevibacter sp.]MEE0943803.1 hypothetical protein [Methanobrevibacter sp.]